MTTGQRIKAARKKAGLTQKELGERMGQSFQSIAQWENDLRNPKLETLQRIANALEVSIYELIDGDDLKRAVIYGEGLDGKTILEEQTQEKRNAVVVALKMQMEKMRQRYGPTAFPEFDELGRLLHKFQSDAISQGEHERIKTLLETVQNRLKQYGEMAPSPQSTLSRQDEELRERWNKLSLSEIFVIPGNHDIVPAPLDDLHGTAKLLKAPIFKMDAITSPDRVARFNRKFSDDAKRPDAHTRYEHSLGTTGLATSLLKQLGTPQLRIAAALDKLNEEGQEKAVERVEELTEIPRYQAQEPPTAPPQDTPALPGGTDTTPAETPLEGPQEPPEGRITSISMICPICGKRLKGDAKTGKAYCRGCNRSFPLPASRSRNK